MATSSQHWLQGEKRGKEGKEGGDESENEEEASVPSCLPSTQGR